MQKESLRDRIKRETKELIYDNAIRLFLEQGYENTTIAQIADETGIGKSTFFNYYESKDAILATFYNNITFKSIESVQLEEANSAKEAIWALISKLVDNALLYPDIYKTMSRIKLKSEAVMSEERLLDSKFSGYCIELLDSGIKTSEFKSKFDINLFTEVLLSILTGTSQEWRISAEPFDLKSKLKQRIEYLFSTISL